MTDRSKYLQRFPDGGISFRFQRKTIGRLPLPGSAAFKARYDRLLASVIDKAKKRGRPAAMIKPKSIGPTIGLFVARWKASDFSHPQKPGLKEVPLAAGTQYHYRLALNLLHKQGVTGLSFADLTRTKPTSTFRRSGERSTDRRRGCK